MKQISTFLAALLVSVLLIGSTSFAQTFTTNWTGGSGSTDWSDAVNWDNGVPTASGNAVINVGASFQPSLSVGSTCLNLSFSGSGTGGLTLNGQNLVVSGNVSLSGGKIIAGAGTMSVAGSWTTGSGSFLPSTSTVTFNGTTPQTVTDASTFGNVTIAGTAAGTIFLNGTLTVSHVLTITGTLNDNGNTITLISATDANPFVLTGTYTSSGTVSYQNGAATNVKGTTYNNLTLNKSSVTFTAAAAISVKGNLTIGAGTTFADGGFNTLLSGNFSNSGIYTTSGSPTFTAQGTSAQSLGAGSFYNLTIANTGAVVTLTSSSLTTIAGTLTINASAILSDNHIQMSTVPTLVNNGTLRLGDATAATQFPVVGTSFTGTGIVEFASTAAQTVNKSANGDYTTLKLSGSGIKTGSGNINFKNLVIGNGVTFASGAANTITVAASGTWTKTGTGAYTPQGTVSFTGSASSTLPAETFNNLTTLGQIKLTGNITVNNTLNLGGALTDQGFTINIQGTLVDASTNNIASGYGLVNFNGSGAQTISNGETFNNLTIASGTVTAQGALIISKAFNILTGATYAANTQTITMDSSFTNSGTVSGTPGAITFTPTPSLTVTITANAPTTLASVEITAGNVTLAGSSNLTVNGMTVDAGATLVIGTSNSIIGTGTFTLASTATLDYSGTGGITTAINGPTLGLNAGANYILHGNATSNQGFPATVNNLTFAGTASTTLTGVTVNGDLTFSGTATTTVSSGVTANGDLYLTSGKVGLVGSSSLTIGSGKTIYVTAGSITLTPAFAGVVNLVYRNTLPLTTGKEVPTVLTTTLNDLTTGSGTLTMGTNAWVNGVLTLGGIVSSSPTVSLIMTSAGTYPGTSSSTKYVNGTMGWQFPSGTALIAKYPIGTAPSNRDVTLNLTATPATTVYVTMVNSSAAALSNSLGTGLQAVSNVRYYTLTSSPATTLTATTSTITLNYTTDESVSDYTHLRIAADNGGTVWNNTNGLGGTGNGTGFIVSDYLSATPSTLAGKYALANANYGGNALPVELSSFTGVSKENGITLNWTTATEITSSKFTIERSSDKATWASIGSIQAAGNSNSPKNYTFSDKNLTGGTSFNYRLILVNASGVSENLGKVITVTAAVPTKFELSQNYPNPFNPSTTIQFSVPKASVVTLKVYNMIGQEVATLVNEQKEVGFYSINWNGKNNYNTQVASGVYIYRIVAGNFVSVKKMNLLK